MVYKCLSQKPYDFIDEFHDNGFLNLEQAINFFQAYPFEEELRDARNNELTDRFSIIKFQNDSNCALSIWKENSDGTFLYYENGKQFAQFFVSNNFLENKEGVSVQRFIELFFSETIESEIILKEFDDEITLEELAKSDDIHKKEITFSFNDNTQKIGNFYELIPWFIATVFIFVFNLDNLYLSLAFSLLWLPSCCLFLTYWRVNKNAVVKIDYSQKTLSYNKDGMRIKFNRNEIDKCFIYEVSSSRSMFSSYSYLHIVLSDRRRIVITNFMTEPRNIVKYLDLNYKVDEVIIPFLPF